MLRTLATNCTSVHRVYFARQLSTSARTMSDEFYSLSAVQSNGQTLDFSTLKGKVVLVVNVASKCGFTPQYKGLQELHDKYNSRGLVILGFPCNQFASQEPGTEEEIVSFCSLNYGVSFPIMKKVDVNGDNAHPVYKWLKKHKKSMMMEMIKWNFEKFLVGPDGQVVERFTSVASPMDHIAPAVEKLLPQ